MLSAVRSVLALLFAGLLLACGPVAAKNARPAGTVEECSWDRPGLHPFMGNVVTAVDRYTDIPSEVRVRLKARMATRAYDEFVDIERDAIIGQRRYDPEIRDMHFGSGRVCRTVTRSSWTPAMRERGMVYCEGEHCILVPTVCRNVSRIRRTVFAAAPEPEAPGEPGMPNEGGYSLYGWLEVQARATQEPGWIGGRGRAPMATTPFLPPYTGGFGWPAAPVPEAPTWMMLGAGVLLVASAARFSRRRDRSARACRA